MFRLGLVGAGRMGRTHLRALAADVAEAPTGAASTGETSTGEASTVAVTAIVEPDPTTRATLFGHGATVHADLAELLRADTVDGILIAAPSDRHAELVEQVASAGLPILCEKPCGLSVGDIARAARAAEEHGVPLQVAYWRRYVPALQALRTRIQGGELGKLHLVASYQWDGQPPAAAFRAHSGGIFIDMGVHEFDQVRWLSGQDFGEIQALASPLVGDPEVGSDVDSAQAIAALSGGATAIISLGRYYPGGDMARVEVFGARDAAGSRFLDPAEGDRAQLEALRRQAQGFAAFASGGPCTGATVTDAAAALEAAQRASAAIPRLSALAMAPS